MPMENTSPSPEQSGQTNKSSKVAKALFFGHRGDEFSQKALQFLLDMNFEVDAVLSERRGDKLPESINSWTGDYIFCFRTYFIVPAHLIERAETAAMNFHPAPPEYPGSGCINFALYDGVGDYGVTAHLINENVDNGKILRVVRFPVRQEDDVKSLLSRANRHLLALFHDIIAGIIADENFIEECMSEASAEKWRGTARKIREVDNHSIVAGDIQEDELSRKIRAFHTDEFPLRLFLHGHEFNLVTKKPKRS